MNVCISFFSSEKPKFVLSPDDAFPFVGDNILIRWKYTVTKRKDDFDPISPVWNYYDENGTSYELAAEYQSKNWTWEITKAECPKRLFEPTQRLYKYQPGVPGVATLNITNVRLADSGRYECVLKLPFESIPKSMKLTVRGLLSNV